MINITNLPTNVRVIAGFMGGGSVLGIAYLFLGNSAAMGIVAVGIIFVVGLLFLYRGILKMMQKRKANPLSQGLSGNAAAAPQGISEPARRARLDDLRRNFEQGVEKFRAAGKNLYSVPWYVLVGEPGSGKTEAIRHCNVGFPPGLQDQLQGAGGTLNMNWWFTNQAIILDTAGRLMFEEVPPGSTNEWNEFLKLLKNIRPNSPLNGMLLVIPVDTLIKDSADQIEKKASKIAQQFDQIQRTLGVRFPVFVIISKCDLLNGFREFFDDLNDPQLQHQIMGWSNPAPLDERFDPATVDKHLDTVKDRLVDRRQHLILDPVNTEDPQARRVDQVDALYALPDAITKIGPRLRRYLEMIFVAGEWSPKPLFLRGIYFTSSMTEGSALDAELAEVLGVPVDSLPEGRVWRRDRAYFLRDLFVEKVFREKGLVTRASNADKQQRTRRAIILSVGFISVLILFTLTWFASRQLEATVGAERDFWATASKYDPKALEIVNHNNGSYTTIDKVPITLGNAKVSIADFFGTSLRLVQNKMEVPVVFKPMTLLSGDIDSQRRIAYRSLFESTVLFPVYDASRKKMATVADNFSPDAAGGLAQLMKLEYANATGKLPAATTDDPHTQADIDALFHFALSADDYATFKKATEKGSDADKLQSVVDWVYTDAANSGKPVVGTKDAIWPPRVLAAGSADARSAIDVGVDAISKYWTSQIGANGESLKNINSVRQALADFQSAETALQALRNQNIDKMDGYNSFKESWSANMAKLKDAQTRAMAAWTLATNNKPDADGLSLSKIYQTEINRITDHGRKNLEALIATTPDDNEKSVNADSVKTLSDARAKLTTALAALKNWAAGDDAKKTIAEIQTLDDQYLSMVKAVDRNSHHRFEAYAMFYDLADQKLVDTSKPPVLTGSLDDAFAAADADYNKTLDSIKNMTAIGEKNDRYTLSLTMSQFTLETSLRAKKFVLADVALKSMPDKPEDWKPFVSKAAPKAVRPPIPLIAFKNPNFEPAFSPDIAGAAADTLKAVRTISLGDSAAARTLDAAALATRSAALQKGFDAYRDEYVQYWRDTVKADIDFSYAKYADLSAALLNVTDGGINEALTTYGSRMNAALTRIGATDEAAAVKAAPKPPVAECSAALASWTNLGGDSAAARHTILAMDPAGFRKDYSVATAKGYDNYYSRFWVELPKAALKLLAKEGQTDININLDILAKLERFPLAPPGDPKSDLTPQELSSARVALEKIRGAAVAALPAGAAGILTRPIGQGGITQDHDIDVILDSLRGSNLLKNKEDYFSKMGPLLAALPTDGKTIAVTITVNKDELKKPGANSPVSDRYAFMLMNQKDARGTDKTLKEASINIANVVDACSVDLPGGDVSFSFRDIPGAPPAAAQVFNGPWSVLRLIDNPNTKNITREGNKWTIEYTFADPSKKTYSLWLIVEFKQPLPDLKDWPVPPAP